MTGAPLSLRGVGYSYPDGHRALDGVDLEIPSSSRVAILGPNGAGKSTLCLTMNGVLLPQRGTVEVAGVTLTRKSASGLRLHVGVVFQDPDDMLFMPTVRQDVAFGPANMGLEPDEVEARVAEALERVGMAHVADRPPHHLSFGQRKRVATAAVLAMRPGVLVLDEPSANLDPRARREFGELLRTLDETLVVVTHDLPYAMELCDRAVVLDEGSVVADGPIGDVLADAELLSRHRLELPAGFSLDGFVPR